eukprot:gb/GFBE01029054.1/.p1 GENE.gb/GFBE01029054.1/~~gb/GFBE01029054.1/.p1  ORF type:complete len:270 (+),score=37.54 gb/GFBE01029054.1/:1-810(+)
MSANSKCCEPVSTAGRLVSACAGSAAVALLVTPLDVAKVRMQAASANGSNARVACPSGHGTCPRECPLFYCSNGITEHCFDTRDKAWKHCFRIGAAEEKLPQKELRLGMLRTLRSIYAEAGAAGLYAGLPITMVIAVPANVLYFATYETMRDWLMPKISSPSAAAVVAPLVAGGFGRAVAVAACAPLEVIRTRVQARSLADGPSPAQGGILAATRDILRQEGFQGLFRGLESTLWRDVPFSAAIGWAWRPSDADCLSAAGSGNLDSNLH